jgi:hypothetical protein
MKAMVFGGILNLAQNLDERPNLSALIRHFLDLSLDGL